MSNLWNIDQIKAIKTFLTDSDIYIKEFYSYIYILIEYKSEKDYLLYGLVFLCFLCNVILYSYPALHFN
jgi:hypothetical protein